MLIDAVRSGLGVIDQMIADCPGQSVDQALADMLGVTDASIRIAAFKAFAQRSETMAVTERAITTSVAALADPEPAIRGYAACIIRQSLSPHAATQLMACLDDPDTNTRAEALKAVALLSPDKAIAGLRAPSTLVRRIAMDALLSFKRDIGVGSRPQYLSGTRSDRHAGCNLQKLPLRPIISCFNAL